MAIAPPNMEEPQAPITAEPDKPEGLEPQTSFNTDSRVAMEAAFEEFNKAPEPEPEPQPQPAPPEADKPSEAATGTPSPEPEPTTSFKTKEEADRGYLEARKKMTEATEKAAQLSREKEEAEKRATEAIGLLMKMTQQAGEGRPRVTPETTAPTQPSLSKEDLDQKFFEDPVGFLFSLTQAANQYSIKKLDERFLTKEEIQRQRTAQIQRDAERQTGDYFTKTYPELSKIEPLVVSEIESIRLNDQAFMEPLIKTRPKNMDDLMGRTKKLVDEAVTRLRGRLPEIGESLGFSVSGQPTKERLTSGAPPLIPGAGRPAPVIRPDVKANVGETNEEYMKRRENQRDRMGASLAR